MAEFRAWANKKLVRTASKFADELDGIGGGFETGPLINLILASALEWIRPVREAVNKNDPYAAVAVTCCNRAWASGVRAAVDAVENLAADKGLEGYKRNFLRDWLRPAVDDILAQAECRRKRGDSWKRNLCGIPFFRANAVHRRRRRRVRGYSYVRNGRRIRVPAHYRSV